MAFLKKDNLSKKVLDLGLVPEHKVMRSGKHTNQVFDFDKVSEKPALLKKVSSGLAGICLETCYNYEVDGVITIGNGANCLARPVTKELTSRLGRPLLSIETSKDEFNNFRAKFGNVFLRHKNLLIVDDVFSYGTNCSVIADLIHKWDGNVAGVGVVVNRHPQSQSSLKLNNGKEVAISSLIEYPIPDYLADDCSCSMP